MADDFEIDPEVAALFEDSGSEESFDGFELGGRDRNNDSDIDLEGLEAEDDDPGLWWPMCAIIKSRRMARFLYILFLFLF